MERINYGLRDNDGKGDPMRVAFLKVESAIALLEFQNQKLQERLDALESRFRIHIREPQE